jgi:rifampicin phosphotransferase
VSTSPKVVLLFDAVHLPVAELGSKAATLARLAAARFPVPVGLVITTSAGPLPASKLAASVRAGLESLGLPASTRYAVRSSAAAEDLPGTSYAGQYETFLDVPVDAVIDAVDRCRQAAASARVAAYRAGRGERTPSEPGIAVLVQPMVQAVAAGVAFTANPLTGDRNETIVTAVRGLGERLVSGQASGDEWSIRGHTAASRRATEAAITVQQAVAVADLARRVQAELGGPQDIEWALDAETTGGLMLLQARPMTALPDPVDWTPPGPGRWMRNFRLGEWLPEPMTPLFADWLMPRIEDGYLDGMRDTVGAVVPFRYASVNGWYYNAIPVPTPALLAAAVARSRGRILPIVFNAIIRVSHNPVAADRAVLGALYRTWRDAELPAYRRLIQDGQAQLPAVDDREVAGIVDRVGRAAGRQLWFLAILGGSAWKMEARLTQFATQHLSQLARDNGPLADGAQVLLRALPGVDPSMPASAVFSADWYWPTASDHEANEHGTSAPSPHPGDSDRRQRLAEQRETAETACVAALSTTPRLLVEFTSLLEVTRRYTVIREEQASTLTLGWPLLRACALRLGEASIRTGSLTEAQQVFFLTRAELDDPAPHVALVEERQARWQRQRLLPAPLTLGKPPPLVGDPLARAVERARGTTPIPAGAIVGQPASSGRASGRVRLITDPGQFSSFQPGEVLLARSTAPAWTPLFAIAAAVVTDGGALAAHASIVAREYGIPAVVGTGDATTRLTTGQHVTVDGTTGTVTLTQTQTRRPAFASPDLSWVGTSELSARQGGEVSD